MAGALAVSAVDPMLLATTPRRALPQWWRGLNVAIAVLSVVGVVLTVFDVLHFDVVTA